MEWPSSRRQWHPAALWAVQRHRMSQHAGRVALGPQRPKGRDPGAQRIAREVPAFAMVSFQVGQPPTSDGSWFGPERRIGAVKTHVHENSELSHFVVSAYFPKTA